MAAQERLGSLSNDDGDGIENGKKAIGLDWQNNDFARASRFFVHLPSLHDHNVKVPKLHVLSRTATHVQDNNFLFLFLNCDTVL